jgi:hypothetical protein
MLSLCYDWRELKENSYSHDECNEMNEQQWEQKQEDNECGWLLRMTARCYVSVNR